MAPLEVIIVGGGLAGACLANGLVNKSEGLVDVTLVERDEAGSERGGYQIRLGSHALTGFKACLTDKQYADLLPCFGRSGGVVSSAPCVFRPSDLKVLLDLSKAPAYEKSAPIGRTRLRDFLQAPLRKRKVIQYSKKYLRYEVLESNASGQSKIKVHFDDGSQRDCDVLISAEGSASRINKQIGLDNIIEDIVPDHGGYLGKCHLPWSVLQTLPKQLVEKGTIYTGNGKAQLFAAIYLPGSLTASRGADDRGFDSDEDEELKKMPLDYDEEQASLFLAIGWTTGPSGPECPHVKDKKALMRQKLEEAGFDSGCLKLVDAVDHDALITSPWRYAKTDTPFDWRQKLLSAQRIEDKPDRAVANSRVWLIGDSIHPMLPSRGMGANNAIHDTADALGPLLELARLKVQNDSLMDNEVNTQLAVYETAMMPRAFAWVKKSSNQQLPDLESLKGKLMIFGIRVLLAVVGIVIGVMELFGWKPKDDAPDLP
jgi:2-polyprenyl-6-methoxyphenol hydroxylase-like FAD-dependent oxidoreductase